MPLTFISDAGDKCPLTFSCWVESSTPGKYYFEKDSRYLTNRVRNDGAELRIMPICILIGLDSIKVAIRSLIFGIPFFNRQPFSADTCSQPYARRVLLVFYWKKVFLFNRPNMTELLSSAVDIEVVEIDRHVPSNASGQVTHEKMVVDFGEVEFLLQAIYDVVFDV